MKEMPEHLFHSIGSPQTWRRVNFSIAILGLCFALGGCSDEPGWRDTSGHGRSPKLAATDQDFCFQTEAKSLPKDPTDADQEKVLQRVQACMKRRGWEFSGQTRVD